MRDADARRFVHPQLNKIMSEYGWIMTGVPRGALYTVGLSSRDHPELMVYGMGPSQSAAILSVAASRVVEENYVYGPGLHDNVVRGYAVQLIEVDSSNFHDWLGQALDYVGPSLRVLQILWCDELGRFPGDPLYDPKFRMQKRFDVRRHEYWEDV